MSFISRDLFLLLELLSLILTSRADSCINDVKHGESFRNSLDKFLGQVYVKLSVIHSRPTVNFVTGRRQLVYTRMAIRTTTK